MDRCDLAVFAEGWASSDGCLAERCYAHDHHIPVEDYTTLEDDLWLRCERAPLWSSDGYRILGATASGWVAQERGLRNQWFMLPQDEMKLLLLAMVTDLLTGRLRWIQEEDEI